MKFIVAFLVAITSASASADFYTGNEWKQMCDDQLAGGTLACVTYLMGIISGLETGFEAGRENVLTDDYEKSNKHAAGLEAMGYIALEADQQKPFCIPDGATAEQLKDVVYKFLLENPSGRTLPLSTLAKNSLSNAFRHSSNCKS